MRVVKEGLWERLVAVVVISVVGTALVLLAPTIVALVWVLGAVPLILWRLSKTDPWRKPRQAERLRAEAAGEHSPSNRTLAILGLGGLVGAMALSTSDDTFQVVTATAVVAFAIGAIGYHLWRRRVL